MRAALVIVAVAALAAGCGRDERGASPPTVVRVVSGSGPAREVATGWVAGDGRVVTVAHALSGGATVRVAMTGGGAPRAARVIARSARLDVAVLAVAGLRGPAPRSSAARAGQPATLWVVRDGVPRPLAATVRRAITARVHDQPGDVPRVRPGLELTAPIAPGDSGAPVLDAGGRLLGVAFARAGGLAYAVSGAAASGILRAAR